MWEELKIQIKTLSSLNFEKAVITMKHRSHFFRFNINGMLMSFYIQNFNSLASLRIFFLKLVTLKGENISTSFNAICHTSNDLRRKEIVILSFYVNQIILT